MKLSIIISLVFHMAAHVHAFDHSHAEWDRILGGHVKGTSFDYAGLKPRRAALDQYLGTLAAVPSNEFNGWQPKQRLAFLINLYNATTVRLVLDHHPLKSIKDIGGAKGPWKQPVAKALGKTHTLDDLEHRLIRGNFAEPRIHFALNCASVGCPPLAKDAFTADQLERQLDGVTRTFLTDNTRNRVDAKRGELWLSPLFDWYGQDFIKQAGTVKAFVARYIPEPERAMIIGGKLQVRFLEYDWALNGR